MRDTSIPARIQSDRVELAVSGRRGTRELTNADDVELETALKQLALNLGCDAVETDMALGVDGGSGHRRHFFGWFWDNLGS